MKKLTYTLMLSLIMGIQLTASAQLSTAFTNRLQVVMDSVCTKLNLKGASVAVSVPNAGIWKGTYGISSTGNPVKSDMLFGIGSNSKTIMAALALKLQENNLLNLDDSIGKWIINKPNINGQATIRQMLNHTSGIFSYTEHPNFFASINTDPFKVWKLEDIYPFVNAPEFAPGTSWSYSNTNYILLGIIIEKTTNKTIQDVLQEYIFTPNGLTQTFYYPQQTPNLEIANPWSVGVGRPYLANMNEIPNWSMYALHSSASTAGGILQTVEDNVKFWDRLISGKMLNESSLKQMKTYVNIGGRDGYGLGIFFYSKALNQRSFYSHGGTFIGYINENMVDTTSGIVFSVLTNQDSISNNTLIGRVIAALHKVTLQMPTTGVQESVYNNTAFSIYPNPAHEKMTIAQEKGETAASFDIIDLTGRLVKSEVLSGNTLSVEDVATGLYTLHLKNNKGELLHVQKIQVVR